MLGRVGVRLLGWFAERTLEALGGAVLGTIVFQLGNASGIKFDAEAFRVTFGVTLTWMLFSAYAPITLLVALAGGLDRTRYVIAHAILFSVCMMAFPVVPAILLGTFWTGPGAGQFGLLIVFGIPIVVASTFIVRTLSGFIPGQAENPVGAA